MVTSICVSLSKALTCYSPPVVFIPSDSSKSSVPRLLVCRGLKAGESASRRLVQCNFGRLMLKYAIVEYRVF